MVVAVVDLAAEAERLVAVAADAERAQDLGIGLQRDRDAGDADAHAVEHAVGARPRRRASSSCR